MASIAPAIPQKKRARVEWLDLFRGAAVLAMIETHVVNTFLAPGLREAAWFGWLEWSNGLVAPAFLFIAGYALGMGGRVEKSGGFARKAKRLGGVAALGYALHFPWMEIGPGRWAEALRTGSQVDVLQCLAAALCCVLAVQALCGGLAEKWRSAGRLAMLSALAAGTVLLAPVSAHWSGGPVPFAAFLNDHTGSLFPLFPWAAFVFAGALAGMFSAQRAGWLLVAAAVVKGCALLADDGVFSALSPAFFGARLAWVLALAALCRGIAWVWTPRGVLFAGRESLVMYAGHLLIIAWSVQAGVPHGGFGWMGVTGIFAVVLGATFAVAWAKAKWSARTRA